MAVPHVGDPAPDFDLPDSHGTPVRLADVDGPVLLVFYPFAFSGICTSELREMRDNIEEFETADVTVFGVSCDAVYTLRAWAEHEGFGFELLCDFWPHGEVARSYGVFDEQSGGAERGSFLIDGNGIVRWSLVSGQTERRDFDGYRAALALL